MKEKNIFSFFILNIKFYVFYLYEGILYTAVPSKLHIYDVVVYVDSLPIGQEVFG